MIAGTVTADREAIVTVKVRAPGGRPERIEAVIDTGFTESLALPRHTIARLGLPFRGSQRVTLGDGRDANVPMHRALVEWHGHPVPVVVLAMDGGALLGMALLQGSRLTVDVTDGGPVRIDALAAT